MECVVHRVFDLIVEVDQVKGIELLAAPGALVVLPRHYASCVAFHVGSHLLVHVLVRLIVTMLQVVLHQRVKGLRVRCWVDQGVEGLFSLQKVYLVVRCLANSVVHVLTLSLVKEVCSARVEPLTVKAVSALV